MNSIVYFASDFHLGIRNSLEREKKIVAWLDQAGRDATHIFLLGDLFDYWFEYRHFVPKGFVRFFGKLAELSDSGIDIQVFTGNHDVWMFDYFPQEMGILVHKEIQHYEFNTRKFWIGHGDGKGPGDNGYKRLKKIFHNPVLQFLYRQLHPDLAYDIATSFSRYSREKETEVIPFLGKDKEWLIQYCELKIQHNPDIDYFVFGHRHLPIYYPLSNQKSVYINTGDWFEKGTYACLRGENCYLYYHESGERIFPPF